MNRRRSCLQPGDVLDERLDAAAGTGGSCAAGTSCPCAGRRRAGRASVRDLRDELHGAGAGADDRDALAAQVVVVVPLAPSGSCGRRRSRRPRSAGSAGWCSWPVARTIASASNVRPSSAVDRPAARVVVPGAGRDLAPSATSRSTPWSRATPLEVVEDLLLRRAQPRPVAALREGERVQVARDVARRARVGVVEPRPADAGGRVEDRDVREAVRCELDRGGDRRRTRPPTMTTFTSLLADTSSTYRAASGTDVTRCGRRAAAYGRVMTFVQRTPS